MYELNVVLLEETKPQKSYVELFSFELDQELVYFVVKYLHAFKKVKPFVKREALGIHCLKGYFFFLI